MEPWLAGALSGAIIGAVGGGLTVVLLALLALLAPQRKCPDCGERIPRLRQPANRREALWGGATCPRCGCEVDRRGRKIERGREGEAPAEPPG